MRSQLLIGLFTAWCANAHAAVQLNGTTVSADGYTIILSDDAAGVGGSLRTGGETVASQLTVRDGDTACATATRRCALVVLSPNWVLRQCDRAEQCADTDTVATTWQSFWSTDLTIATWLRWQDAGAAATTHSLLSADLPAVPNAQLTWWQDPAAASQTSNADGWSVAPCASPLALSLPTNGGTVQLAASWTGFAPATCDASANGELTLEMARATPANGTEATLIAAVELDGDADTAIAALDRLLTSPTTEVTVGSRWIVDDDDVIDGLGVAALVLDTDQERLVWTVAPTDGRTRERLRYLVRGVINDGRLLGAYRDNGEPLEDAVSEPLGLAAARVFTAAREWRAWQSDDTVCVQNNQWCYEAASPLPFSGLYLDIASGTADLDADWQYWNGTTWSSLTLTSSDSAANLTVSGAVRWQLPADWQPSSTELDGVALELFAVRVRSNPGFSGPGATLTEATPDLLLFTANMPVTEATTLRLTLNQRPVAATTAANLDIARDETARLDGEPSFDPDGTTLTYAWRQSSGPADAELGSSDEAVATAQLPESGLYVFELVVSDGDLESAPAFVVVRAGTFADVERGCACSAAPHWTLALAVFALRRRQGRTVK